MTAKRKPTKKIKRDIEKAVEAIPKLVQSETPQKKGGIPQYQEPRGATFFTWFGVITIALTILVLWIWNMRTMILDVVSDDPLDSALIDESREDFNSLLDALKQDEQENITEPIEETPEEEADVRETLRTLIEEQSTSPSTST